MNHTPFTPAQVRPIRDAMTISRPAHLGSEVPVTWFSLGNGTSITPEYYDCTTLYPGGEGSGEFLLGGEGRSVPLCPGDFASFWGLLRNFFAAALIFLPGALDKRGG